MHLKIQALVLRVVNYNDTDALLTVLSDTHGKITLKARGLRRKNSPLVAPGQLLAYGEFTVFEYRGYYTINEAQSLELFAPLRKDITRLSLATYFAQVTETLAQEEQPDPELLSLTLNCLHILSYTATPESKVKAVFELRSACLSGYMPELSKCYLCGSEYPDRFDIFEGRLECSKCMRMSEGGLRMPITAGVLEAMRYICFCDAKRLFSFDIGAESIELLSNITEGYLSTQLERGFSALDFYKSLSETACPQMEKL